MAIRYGTKIVNGELLKSLMGKFDILPKTIYDGPARTPEAAASRKKSEKVPVSRRSFEKMKAGRKRCEVEKIGEVARRLGIEGLTKEDLFLENGVTLEEIIGRKAEKTSKFDQPKLAAESGSNKLDENISKIMGRIDTLWPEADDSDTSNQQKNLAHVG